MRFLPQEFQCQDQHRHAPIQNPLEEVGCCRVPVVDIPQGCVQHEAAQGPEDYPEECMTFGSQREAWTQGCFDMEGPVEVDETFIGGKRKNMPTSRRKELTGRGAVGKTVMPVQRTGKPMP